MPRVSRIHLLLAAGALLLPVAAQAPAAPAFAAGLAWRCLGPNSGPVSAVAGVAGQPGRYTLWTPSGETWRTLDGGETWREVDRVAPPPAGATQWTDPADSGRRIRVAAAGGVEITLDGGARWQAWRNLPIAQVAGVTVENRFPAVVQATLADGNMVELPLRDDVGAPGAAAPAAPPVPANLKFRGTANGVEVSLDGGASWRPLQLNLPTVAVKQVVVAGDTLLAATWGRSVWALDEIEPLEQLAAAAPGPDAIRLFAPATVVRLRRDKSDLRPSDLGAPRIVNPPLGGYFDFYLPQVPSGAVTLEVVDASGRVLRHFSSLPDSTQDMWLPVHPTIDLRRGEVRVAWDGRADPPVSPMNKYTRLAPVMNAAEPQPDGPLVPAGDDTLRLTVAGRGYTQPLHVVDDPRAPVSAAAASARWQFDQQMIAALAVAHAGYRQVEAVRAALHPLLTDSDADLAQAAQDLDTQLAQVDGASWTGLVLPDEIETEVEPIEDKDDDIDPPFALAQSLTQDYDDPTTILGRSYGNADTGPTFANTGQALAQALQASEGSDAAPTALDTGSWNQTCSTLATVVNAWQAALAAIPALNNSILAHHLKPLPLPAQPVAGPVCGN